MNRLFGLSAAALAVATVTGIVAAAPSALATNGGPSSTSTSAAFNTATTVAAGTIVTITGTVVCTDQSKTPCVSNGDPVTVGDLDIDRRPGGCGNGNFTEIGSGGLNGSGKFSTDFNTTAFAGQTLGIRAHYQGVGGQFSSSQTCIELTILDDTAIIIEKTVIEGPLDGPGGALIDSVGDQTLTPGIFDAGEIWVGLDGRQHFEFEILLDNDLGFAISDHVECSRVRQFDFGGSSIVGVTVEDRNEVIFDFAVWGRSGGSQAARRAQTESRARAPNSCSGGNIETE